MYTLPKERLNKHTERDTRRGEGGKVTYSTGEELKELKACEVQTLDGRERECFVTKNIAA